MRYTQENLPNIIKATGRQPGFTGKSWANFKQDSSIMKGNSTQCRVVTTHMYGQMQTVLTTAHGSLPNTSKSP